MRFYLTPARRLLMESHGLCYNSGQTAAFRCRQEDSALFIASEAPPTNELHCSYENGTKNTLRPFNLFSKQERSHFKPI